MLPGHHEHAVRGTTLPAMPWSCGARSAVPGSGTTRPAGSRRALGRQESGSCCGRRAAGHDPVEPVAAGVVPK